MDGILLTPLWGELGEKSGCDIVSRSLSWEMNRGVTTLSSGHLSGVTAAHNGTVLNSSGTTHRHQHMGVRTCRGRELWSENKTSSAKSSFALCRRFKWKAARPPEMSGFKSSGAWCNVRVVWCSENLAGSASADCGLRVSPIATNQIPPPSFLFKTYFTPCCCFSTVLQ